MIVKSESPLENHRTCLLRSTPLIVFTMTDWYYARSGKQSGPVTFEQLVEIARSGGLDPLKDLVWNQTMKDWRPAGQVPDLFSPPASPAAPVADPSNPYAAPDSTWTEVAQVTAGEALVEILPGSEPIDVGGCVKRGFDLTCRNFGMILLAMLIYIGVLIVSEMGLAWMDAAFGLIGPSLPIDEIPDSPMENQINQFVENVGRDSSALNIFLSELLSVFLSLGATRMGLNVVSGREFSLGMLFGGGRKLVPAFAATVLYLLMIGVGLLLLIVPGIYLAMRYGHYLTAMVDRDMGVMESFQYSSSITTNNRMNLFLLLLLTMLVAAAGCLALCIGIVFAFPVAWLAWIVAYRWMQYGHRAALDQHGTTTTMLAGL